MSQSDELKFPPGEGENLPIDSPSPQAKKDGSNKNSTPHKSTNLSGELYPRIQRQNLSAHKPKVYAAHNTESEYHRISAYHEIISPTETVIQVSEDKTFSDQPEHNISPVADIPKQAEIDFPSDELATEVTSTERISPVDIMVPAVSETISPTTGTITEPNGNNSLDKTSDPLTLEDTSSDSSHILSDSESSAAPSLKKAPKYIVGILILASAIIPLAIIYLIFAKHQQHHNKIQHKISTVVHSTSHISQTPSLAKSTISPISSVSLSPQPTPIHSATSAPASTRQQSTVSVSTPPLPAPSPAAPSVISSAPVVPKVSSIPSYIAPVYSRVPYTPVSTTTLPPRISTSSSSSSAPQSTASSSPSSSNHSTPTAISTATSSSNPFLTPPN